MRLNLAAIAIFLSSATAWAQDTTFVKFYGGAENETGADLVQVGNHFYIVGTYGSGGHGLTDLYVVKTDTLGNRVWTKTLGTPAVEMATAAAALGDTAVIIVGYTNSTFENTYDGLLTLIDSAGNELWSRTPGGTAWDMLHSVMVDPQGNIVAVGETSSNGAGGADGWLVKYDSHGNPLGEITYGGPDEDRLKTIAQLTPTEYIMGGDFESGAIDSTDIIIIRTDLNGNTLHTKYHGGTGRDIVNKVVVSPNLDVVIAGATSTGSVGGLDFNLMRTDILGNVSWQEIFGGPDDEQWRDAFVNLNPVILCTGHSYSEIGGGKEEVFLYRFFLGGWFEQLTTFGSFDNDYGMAIVSGTMPNTYIFAGTTDSFGCGNSDMILGRSKADGSFGSYSSFEFCDTTGVLSSVDDSRKLDFKVYRNISNCVIEFGYDADDLTVHLFCSDGRLISVSELLPGRNEFPIPIDNIVIGRIVSSEGSVRHFILPPYVR